MGVRFESVAVRQEAFAGWLANGPENRDDDRKVGGSTPHASVVSFLLYAPETVVRDGPAQLG